MRVELLTARAPGSLAGALEPGYFTKQGERPTIIRPPLPPFWKAGQLHEPGRHRAPRASPQGAEPGGPDRLRHADPRDRYVRSPDRRPGPWGRAPGARARDRPGRARRDAPALAG